MIKSRLLVASILLAGAVFPGLAAARQGQTTGGGDQILDGIGETALTARYLLNTNAEDASRNSLHATVRGAGATFVDDPRFGKVLQLAGDGSFVQVPGKALNG